MLSVVVQEFSSDGGNVPTHHPAMEEPTALARWSEIETATLGLVTVITLYKKLREGVKVEKKKSTIIIVLFLRGGGGSEVIIVLFILILKWPNSSRNAKKKFSPW